MRRPRTVFGALGLWEALRFVALAVLLVALFRIEIEEDPRLVLWLILALCAHLPLIAAFLVLAHDPVRNAALVPVVRTAKAVSIFAAALTLSGEPRGETVHELRLTFLSGPVPHYLVLIVIICLDVVCMAVLLTGAIRPAPPAGELPPPDSRPLYDARTVEDAGEDEDTGPPETARDDDPE